MNRFNIAIYLIVSLLVDIDLYAKEGGEPTNFSFDEVEFTNTYTLSEINPADLIEEDKLNLSDTLELSSSRFSVSEDDSYELTSADNGSNQKLRGEGKVWALRIFAPNALNLNLGFVNTELPPGTELWIRSTQTERILGPYVSEDVFKKELWTPVIQGNQLEVVIFSAPNSLHSEVTIGSFNKGYKRFGIGDPCQPLGLCHKDATCLDESLWSDQVKSVGVFTIGGGATCTGQLVNNSSSDFRAYFLTAKHCLPAIDADSEILKSLVFYWNHQRQTCDDDSDEGNLLEYQQGAHFISKGKSDFLLLELAKKPKKEFDTFLAGWDITNSSLYEEAISIHHPNGEVKSFGSYKKLLLSSGNSEQPGDRSSGSIDHWFIKKWDRGMVSNGSSGACLWESENQRCVGILHSGFAGCNNCDGTQCERNRVESAWYGKLSVSWGPTSDPKKSLQHWLDPAGGSLTLNGIDTWAK